MSNQPTPKSCNALTDDGYCEKSIIQHQEWCEDHIETGRKDFGVRSTPTKLPDRLDPNEIVWIDQLVVRYLQDADFDTTDPQQDLLTFTIMQMWQAWQGTDRIVDSGMSEDVQIDRDSAGLPVFRTEEHHLSQRVDRLSDRVRYNLKDLGLLNDPDSQQAEAMTSLSSLFSDQ